jgi:hypothetical protein
MYSEMSYKGFSPTFRAANGFVTQNASNQVFTFNQYTFFFEGDGLVQRFSPNLIAGYFWNVDGERKDEFLWTGFNMQMKGQTFVHARILLASNEIFAGRDFRGLRRVNFNVNSNFSQRLTLGAFASYGREIWRNTADPQMGRGTEFSVWATLKPTSRLSISPRFMHSRLDSEATGDEFFSGYIVRNRLNYQFTKRLFMRVITQYNDFSKSLEVDPLVTYKVNPFTAVYLGSTHDLLDFDERSGGTYRGFYQTQRQFFFKIQYLFRV